jgi:P-type Cu+ transporter
MFNFLKKKPQGETVTFKIDGMHCTSCSMNIDGELEETEGVISANTNYPKSKTVITYNPAKVNSNKLKEVIESLDYKAVEAKESSS